MEGRGLLRGGAILLILSLIRLGVDQVGKGGVYAPEGDSEVSRLLDESLEEKAEADRRSRPLAPGETLDPNRIGEEDFDRLPGVGPATARALVADREEKGGFREAEDLLRVPGIGPAKLAKMARYLDFSQGVPLELARRSPRDRAGRVGRPIHSPVEREKAPGLSRSESGGGMEGYPGGGNPREVLDLNRASARELETLPGIGPTLAQRVVESRSRDGPFRSPQDLLRVRGIGPVVLARIRGLVRAGG